MKTPRDILLARHRPAEPKLDQIRANVLEELAVISKPEALRAGRSEPREIFSALRFALGLLRALRPNAFGLAGVWLLILFFKLATPEPPINQSARASASGPALQAALAEQQRLLAELGELPVSRIPREATKADVPRPRSERQSSRASA